MPVRASRTQSWIHATLSIRVSSQSYSWRIGFVAKFSRIKRNCTVFFSDPVVKNYVAKPVCQLYSASNMYSWFTSDSYSLVVAQNLEECRNSVLKTQKAYRSTKSSTCTQYWQPKPNHVPVRKWFMNCARKRRTFYTNTTSRRPNRFTIRWWKTSVSSSSATAERTTRKTPSYFSMSSMISAVRSRIWSCWPKLTRLLWPSRR